MYSSTSEKSENVKPTCGVISMKTLIQHVGRNKNPWSSWTNSVNLQIELIKTMDKMYLKDYLQHKTIIWISYGLYSLYTFSVSSFWQRFTKHIKEWTKIVSCHIQKLTMKSDNWQLFIYVDKLTSCKYDSDEKLLRLINRVHWYTPLMALIL